MKMLSVLFVVVGCAGASPSPTATRAVQTPATPTLFTTNVAGSGRPVILIPGLGCPGTVWDETVAHLGAGFETHVITMAGFAGQPAVAGASLVKTRDAIGQYIRDHELQHPIVIGHSAGGFIAYWLAASEPDLVGPIVVVDEALFIPAALDPAATVEGAKIDTAEFRDHMLSLAPDAFAKQLRTMFSSMTAKPVRLAATIDAITRSDQKTIANEIYELFTTDLRPEAPKIRVPTLAVLAEYKLADGMAQQAQLIPDHEVKVIPGARHFVMTDEPAAFFGVLDDFVARHPAR